jgi:hypothetical protein
VSEHTSNNDKVKGVCHINALGGLRHCSQDEGNVNYNSCEWRACPKYFMHLGYVHTSIFSSDSYQGRR